MKNKVIIKVSIPNLDVTYDVVIPVNEQVWKINKLLTKLVYDLNSLVYYPTNDNYIFINKMTSEIYPNNEVILNTNIRNGTELIMVYI